MAPSRNQRVAILVDSENLEISARQNYEPTSPYRKTHTVFPDWKIIIPMVTAGRTIVRNIYYKKKQLNVSKKFRTLWENELCGEFRQPIKSVDPYIIVDAITLSEKVDTVILLAGDKDYLPLIWYLKSRGCKVEIASFPDAASREVKGASDEFYSLGSRHTVALEPGRR